MKSKKGVTLIALVITIIVLLILAGVSISMVTGDNGIASKATEAKEKTNAATEKEEQDLKDTFAYIDENTKNSNENVDADDTDETPDEENTENEITFLINGTTYTAIEGMKWEEWVTKTEYNTNSVWQICDGTTDGSDIGYEYIGSYTYEGAMSQNNIHAIADTSAVMAYIKPEYTIIANQDYSVEEWASAE